MDSDLFDPEEEEEPEEEPSNDEEDQGNDSAGPSGYDYCPYPDD